VTVLDCVLISRDEDFRRQVTQLVRRAEGQARLSLDLPSAADELPREALSHVLAAKPQVVFLDLGEASTTGARVLKALGQDAPEIAVIVAGPVLEADTLLEIMRAGAAEYLPRPLGDDDTATAFQRLRRRVVSSRTETPDVEGRLFSVFSAKGGTGVSTVAVNLAVDLRERTGQPVLLLDLAPALGTAALLLGLRPRYSYLDVVQNFHRIDDELLESFLETSETGVSVLASPSTLVPDVTRPGVDQIMGLLRLCRRHFGFVVVDAGTAVSDLVEHVLRESDERLAVSTPELPTLRNLKRALELVGPSANGHGPPKVVLNQYREGTGVSRREVEEALAQPVFATLEWDSATLTQSVNLGRPAVSAAGRSRFGKDLTRLGKRLAGDSAAGGAARAKGLSKLLNSFRDKSSG
jgi:pilus assembly protein CpaE